MMPNVLVNIVDKEEVAMYQSWDEYPLNRAINRIEYCPKHPWTNW